MLKVNTARIAEFTWSSPEGEIIGAGKEISEELGRKPDSTDLNERHPFDVEICRIPPGKTPYVTIPIARSGSSTTLSRGSGVVRHTEEDHADRGRSDAFLFRPNEPHQIINDGAPGLDSLCRGRQLRWASHTTIPTATSGPSRYQSAEIIRSAGAGASRGREMNRRLTTRSSELPSGRGAPGGSRWRVEDR